MCNDFEFNFCQRFKIKYSYLEMLFNFNDFFKLEFFQMGRLFNFLVILIKEFYFYFSLWLNLVGMRFGLEGQFGDFIEGLGFVQLVGRQVLGFVCFGEIQLSFYDRKYYLEVEVIRVRGFILKVGVKIFLGLYDLFVNF